MTLNDLQSRAHEIFSSFLIFCPTFPPNAETNATKKFEELRRIVGEIRDRTKSDDAKRWLNISLQEITQSEDHYEKGKREMGQDVIQRAEGHFRNAFATKQTQARFLTGESGTAIDSESGFPA